MRRQFYLGLLNPFLPHGHDSGADEKGSSNPFRKYSSSLRTRACPWPVLLALALFPLFAGCKSAPVPLSDQETLDLTRIVLPDTLLPGSPDHTRMVHILESMGFHWNNPHFTLGRHLIRGNEVAWFDSGGILHITRYIGIFQGNGYRINRYFPSTAGDLEHRGTHIRPGLFLCLFDRPAEAVHYHRSLSSMALLAEVAMGGTIDTAILPISFPFCLLSDRRPERFLRSEKTDDEESLKQALGRYSHLTQNQKGKPIPTYVTAPASVE